MSYGKLKNGKLLDFPSLFVALRSGWEARIFKEVNATYPMEPSRHEGIKRLEGIWTSIKDWRDISNSLEVPFLDHKQNTLDQTYSSPFPNRTLVIEPAINILFIGTKNDKNKMFKTGLFSSRLKKTVKSISAIKGRSVEKFNRNIKELYPLLDTPTIRNILAFQIKNGADIIVSPSVPITTTRDFKIQLQKFDDMNRISRNLFDTSFKAIKDQRDLMQILALNTSVVLPEYIDPLTQALLKHKPDHVGLWIMNMDEDNTSRIEALLKLIENIAQAIKKEEKEREKQEKEGKGKLKIPFHVVNVSEFGYVTFCYGIDCMAKPIVAHPYFVRIEEGAIPKKEGAYYHPIEMTYVPKDILLDKTRSNHYRLPCHCEICSEYETVIKVERWNKFRRIHTLLVKSMEMKEIKVAKEQGNLREALHDKFARSKKTGWVAFLS